ncbi:type II 3-dehydroquinate dehydratase [Timonella sp. A28]|uniref:type II 3-dehydroquinate dehydratase n=1 Tax=Timonella sp. A28 TaxID=3442640 RepID=UPI003EBFAACC
MADIVILNGPNLGRLGVREPDVYGTLSYDDLVASAQSWGSAHDLTVEVFQTDSESEMIGWLHAAVDEGADVVLNPAAFTHFSYAIRDAAAMVTKGGRHLIEVHISNPYAREEFRHHSVVGGIATGTIAGFGFHSYKLAIEALVHLRA